MVRIARIVVPGLPHHVTQEFVAGLEILLGRKIARRAPGRRPKTEAPVAEQLELL
jgi:hypothetical protein